MSIGKESKLKKRKYNAHDTTDEHGINSVDQILIQKDEKPQFPCCCCFFEKDVSQEVEIPNNNSSIPITTQPTSTNEIWINILFDPSISFRNNGLT